MLCYPRHVAMAPGHTALEASRPALSAGFGAPINGTRCSRLRAISRAMKSPTRRLIADHVADVPR
jgi:hypothetical protein